MEGTVWCPIVQGDHYVEPHCMKEGYCMDPHCVEGSPSK